MSYRDEMVVCESCGEKFVYTVEEQRAQQELGFEPKAPDRCSGCREQEPQPGLRPGVVKWYSHEKGFGFLVQPDGTEVFFHRTGIIGEPEKVAQENTSVWYQLQSTDRGLQAYDVHPRD
ncbi:MAG: cold shock domain-containing protein [Anaerolineales bacterium]